MVLFDEDPVTLIRETTHQFHIAPDRDSLLRIGDSLSTLSSARAARLAHQSSLVKTLSRRLNGLQEGRRWEEDRHDAGGHAERMLRMDTEKFRVAKEVSNAGFEQERLEGELSSLRSVVEGLEREGVEGAVGAGRSRRAGEGEAEDEVVLKLHLYRSLNITPTQDPTTGSFTRAVVHRRGTSNSDDVDGRANVTVIDLSDGARRGSPSAGQFWDAM